MNEQNIWGQKKQVGGLFLILTSSGFPATTVTAISPPSSQLHVTAILDAYYLLIFMQASPKPSTYIISLLLHVTFLGG